MRRVCIGQQMAEVEELPSIVIKRLAWLLFYCSFHNWVLLQDYNFSSRDPYGLSIKWTMHLDIDYEEFVDVTLHMNKDDREDHLFVAFSKFNKDGSGCIIFDEL